jgi:hypothetical protein
MLHLAIENSGVDKAPADLTAQGVPKQKNTNFVCVCVFCILLTEEMQYSSHFHFHHGIQDIKYIT